MVSPWRKSSTSTGMISAGGAPLMQFSLGTISFAGPIAWYGSRMGHLKMTKHDLPDLVVPMSLLFFGPIIILSHVGHISCLFTHHQHHHFHAFFVPLLAALIVVPRLSSPGIYFPDKLCNICKICNYDYLCRYFLGVIMLDVIQFWFLLNSFDMGGIKMIPIWRFVALGLLQKVGHGSTLSPLQQEHPILWAHWYLSFDRSINV
jgi:hypothetical protein